MKKGGTNRLALRLVDSIPTAQEGLFNPWVEQCSEDLTGNEPDVKLQRLVAHLDCDPEFILCGEAAGYQGCRHSGMAFTSERLLLAGSIPRVERPAGRLTSRKLPYSEPSATIVWNTLYRLKIEQRTILWNALQMHPFKTGNTRSNRTPSAAEIALGRPAMKLLVKAFPNAKLVAVGKKAEGLLQEMDIPMAGAVRHPANGGATAFAAGVERLAKG